MSEEVTGIRQSSWEDKKPDKDLAGKIREEKRIIRIPKGSDTRVSGYTRFHGDSYDFLISNKSINALSDTDGDAGEGLDESSMLDHDALEISDIFVQDEETPDSFIAGVDYEARHTRQEYCLRILTAPPDYNTINEEALKTYALDDPEVQGRIAVLMKKILGTDKNAIHFARDLKGTVHHKTVNIPGVTEDVTVFEKRTGYSEVEWTERKISLDPQDISFDIEEDLGGIYDAQRDAKGELPPNSDAITTTYINLMLAANDKNSKIIPLPRSTPLEDTPK